MALQAENVCRVSRRGFGEPCQAELLPRRMYLTGTRWMPQGGSRNEENESDRSEILAAGCRGRDDLSLTRGGSGHAAPSRAPRQFDDALQPR
jgi:hypothetical protein